MKITKEHLISICLGLVNLVNKNFTQDFLDTNPSEINLSYELGTFNVSFKLTNTKAVEAERGQHNGKN